MEEVSNKKRIVKNTLMLYFRQILILLVSLYSVRVVLNVLGAEDYGVYNVVAGIVTMFSFLSTAMAASTQRFYSFALGQKDLDELKKIFCITLEIYVVLILIVVLVSESFGLWFVADKLVIPAGRLNAALVVYQFAILSFVFGLGSAPFMALIISHEDMSVYAYVSIIEALLKLVIVFVLKFLDFDKLVLYGALLSFVTFVIAAIYFAYCRQKYAETEFSLTWNKKIFTEISAFSGWCLFGTGAGIVKNQITNIFLNMFFGPVVNAARGIAMNVNSAVMSFSSNFNMAVRPQIVKNYSVGNKDGTFNLVFQSTKLSFLLLFVFLLPLYLEMDYVLTLWLKNVPDLTVTFTRLILIEFLFDAFSYPLQSLSQASGKMKLYQSVVGGTLLLNLPFAYIALRFGFCAYSVQFVAIFIGFLAFVLRVFINSCLTGLKTKDYFLKTFLPCFISALCSSILPFIVYFFLKDTFLRLVLVVAVSVLSISFFGLTVCLNKDERNALFDFIRRKTGGGK